MPEFTPSVRNALRDFRRSVYRNASRKGRVRLDSEPLRRGILQTMLQTYRRESGRSVSNERRAAFNVRAKQAAKSLSGYALRESREFIKRLRKEGRGETLEAVREELERLGLAEGSFYRLSATLTTLQTAVIELVKDEDAEGFWGYRYETAADERVRASHRPFHRKAAYPKDHAFWLRWTPPNGFNCRCRRKKLKHKPRGWREIPLSTWPDPDPGFEGTVKAMTGL